MNKCILKILGKKVPQFRFEKNTYNFKVLPIEGNPWVVCDLIDLL